MDLMMMMMMMIMMRVMVMMMMMIRMAVIVMMVIAMMLKGTCQKNYEDEDNDLKTNVMVAIIMTHSRDSIRLCCKRTQASQPLLHMNVMRR